MEEILVVGSGRSGDGGRGIKKLREAVRGGGRRGTDVAAASS